MKYSRNIYLFFFFGIALLIWVFFSKKINTYNTSTNLKSVPLTKDAGEQKSLKSSSANAVIEHNISKPLIETPRNITLDSTRKDSEPLAPFKSHRDMLWEGYTSKLPKLKGYYYIVDGRPWTESEKQQIMSKTATMASELNNAAIRGLKFDEVDAWKKKFEIVKENYIKAAVDGDPYAAWWLASEYSMPPIKDHVERLSWIMIAISMGFKTAPEKVCGEVASVCSDENIKRAYEQANFYIDFYGFELDKNSD